MASTTTLEYIQIAAILCRDVRNSQSRNFPREFAREVFHGWKMRRQTPNEVGKKFIDEVSVTDVAGRFSHNTLTFDMRDAFLNLFNQTMSVREFWLRDESGTLLYVPAKAIIPFHISKFFPNSFASQALSKEDSAKLKSAMTRLKSKEKEYDEEYAQLLEEEISPATAKKKLQLETEKTLLEDEIQRLNGLKFEGSPISAAKQDTVNIRRQMLQKVLGNRCNFDYTVVDKLKATLIQTSSDIKPNLKAEKAWLAANALFEKAGAILPPNMKVFHQGDPLMLDVKDNALDGILEIMDIGIKAQDGINKELLSPVDLLLVDGTKQHTIQGVMKTMFPKRTDKKTPGREITVRERLVNFTPDPNNKTPMSYRNIMLQYFERKEMIGVSLKQPEKIEEYTGVVKTVGIRLPPGRRIPSIDPMVKFYEKYVKLSNGEKDKMIDDFIHIDFAKFDVRPTIRSWAYPITFQYDNDNIGIPDALPNYKGDIVFKLYTWAEAGFNGQWVSPKHLLPSNWTGGIGISATNYVFGKYSQFTRNDGIGQKLGDLRAQALQDTILSVMSAEAEEVRTFLVEHEAQLKAELQKLRQPRVMAHGKDLNGVYKLLNEAFATTLKAQKTYQEKSMFRLMSSTAPREFIQKMNGFFDSRFLEVFGDKNVGDNFKNLLGKNYLQTLESSTVLKKITTNPSRKLAVDTFIDNLLEEFPVKSIKFKGTQLNYAYQVKNIVYAWVHYSETALTRAKNLVDKNRDANNYVFMFKARCIDLLLGELISGSNAVATLNQYSWTEYLNIIKKLHGGDGRQDARTIALRYEKKLDSEAKTVAAQKAIDGAIAKIKKSGTSNIDAHFIASQCAFFLYFDGATQAIIKKQIFLSIFGLITKSGHSVFSTEDIEKKSQYIFSKWVKQNEDEVLAHFALAPYIVLS